MPERAVLAVLLEHRHRVLSRGELSRLAGFNGLSDRRCDSVLVQVRRVLGPGAVATVRGRGWMLHPNSIEAAQLVLDQQPG